MLVSVPVQLEITDYNLISGLGEEMKGKVLRLVSRTANAIELTSFNPAS